jgi:tRNA A-37 threonylcarbamoyl transferase component Bud32
MLKPGDLLQNRYRIVQAVGGGGMGQVYLTHDTRLGDKPCAVKELVPDPHATPQEQEQAAAQFRREAAILAHLNHPNLPNVYDYFAEGGRFYLTMDYVEGETLTDQLARSPDGLPQGQVLEWAIQLCDVLAYLHGQTPPVIFRDMKPDNVMVTPEGDIKLIDFGVARMFDPSKRTDTLKMGTAGYAPPEQFAGQGQTTPRSDIYALGVTLHELLTGDDPTAHPFVFTTCRELNPAISLTLSNVTARAMSLDPAERFLSAQAMKEALKRATQPRRLRLPAIQRKRGTGTVAMPATEAIPVQRTRTSASASASSRTARGIARWMGRLLLTLVLALLVTALVLTLVGAFVLSSVIERAIVSTDWELDTGIPVWYVMTEEDLGDGLQEALEPYTLDALGDVSADFHPPDTAELYLELFSQSIWLEGRVEAREGIPAVILERVNDIPLYVVGGIVSGGINHGFQKAWEDSPLRIVSLSVQPTQLTVHLEP